MAILLHRCDGWHCNVVKTVIHASPDKMTNPEAVNGDMNIRDVRVAIDEALKCKEEGKSKTILIAHSGHGHFDLAAYEKYLSGQLEDYAYPEEEVRKAQLELPKVA